MKFVDVQPNFSLDYAWTSPSPTVMHTTKSSRTSRKQNRCCDQCRKGKRACDAAILEDTLLDGSKTDESPTLFHYSDVYGPLAPCRNCDKTKKNCTFEWLKSQRIAQSNQSQASPVPPAKRRRTSEDKTRAAKGDHKHIIETVIPGDNSFNFGDNSSFSGGCPSDFGVTFADFAGGPSAFDLGSSATPFQSISSASTDTKSTLREQSLWPSLEEPGTSSNSSDGSSLQPPTQDIEENTDQQSQLLVGKHDEHGPSSMENGNAIHCNRKRSRYGSSTSASHGAPPYPAISFASHITSSTNSTILKEHLLRIYHNSFENALSCWVTQRTCPHTSATDVANDAGLDWNRIYFHVFRLDRLAKVIRGRQFTFEEHTRASTALNLAIYAFATQWAKPSHKSNARFPFNGAKPTRDVVNVVNGIGEDLLPESGPEHSLRATIWHEARNAIQKAAELESFRVALAQIIFALTHKHSDGQEGTALEENSSASALEQEIDECDDLMSQLNLAIEADGPPTHLEQGLRLIHSLRTRLIMNCRSLRSKPGASASQASHPDAADRTAVDLVFWIGVIFDTLSSAITKRPLVVSDEDSNIYPVKHESAEPSRAEQSPTTSESNGTWNADMFDRSNTPQASIVRWPCSFDQAAVLLCNAAPVKVCLFRKITRIQTLFARNVRGARIEACLDAALKVYSHWAQLYAPFIQDCLENHHQLHPRIQSWYTCLAAHWHLAALLLADLIEIADESLLGLETQRDKRASSGFVATFREQHCRMLSAMARCACPRDDALHAQGVYTAQDSEALMSEPWTAILIRAFAKAGAIYLDADTMLPATSLHGGSSFHRADDCVRALCYLSRRSNMAHAAARVLGKALSQRRGAQRAAGAFLDGGEIWHAFGDLVGEFGGGWT